MAGTDIATYAPTHEQKASIATFGHVFVRFAPQGVAGLHAFTINAKDTRGDEHRPAFEARFGRVQQWLEGGGMSPKEHAARVSVMGGTERQMNVR